jgi:hypothetical protein
MRAKCLGSRLLISYSTSLQSNCIYLIKVSEHIGLSLEYFRVDSSSTKENGFKVEDTQSNQLYKLMLFLGKKAYNEELESLADWDTPETVKMLGLTPVVIHLRTT